MTKATVELIRSVAGHKFSRYHFRIAYKRGLTCLKYVRKFTMNAMYEVGLAPDVTRFLAGEKPRTVLEEHYIDVERMAEQQYTKYLKYLARLRRKI